MLGYILLVDDDEEILISNKQTLEDWEYTVDAAISIPDARNFLEKSPHYDLILSDLRLSGHRYFHMQDQAFFELLRRNYSDIPVMAYCNDHLGELLPADTVQALRAGCVDLYIFRPPIDLLDFGKRLNEVIRKREFRCIMFTDIKGSSGIFSKYEDHGGIRMIQTHNKVLFPIVVRNDGIVVKTIGDSIMASFKSRADAIKASIAMQKALKELNEQEIDSDKQIHIRIGMHAGEVWKTYNDLFGNVVNIAARVETEAEEDEIYITGQVENDLVSELRAICYDLGEKELRGTGKTFRLFTVDWQNY